MGRNIFRQEEQIRKSDAYVDNIAPTEAAFETNPSHLEDDLNNIRSQLHNLLKNHAGNWWDDLNIPSTLETGTERGINDLNTDLHAVEKKRVLRNVFKAATDITVGAGNAFVVLALGELPSNTTAAVGAVSTLGTVAAFHAGIFGTHSLDEVAGSHALAPKNLCKIVDASTGDPILSGLKEIWALFQTETATDGHTMTGTTPVRAQLSFVIANTTNDDLIICPSADIENKVINYHSRERVRWEDLSEQDFLDAAQVDIGSGVGNIDRQTAYTNQTTTPVDLTTNAVLDLESPGIVWSIRDDAEADLFRIIEGSAGGTSEIEISAGVDIFDVDAVTNNFLNGLAIDTGAAGTTINVGVTANQIDSGGALSIQSGGSADLSLVAALELNLTDSYRSSSTWSLADGISLADSAAEWTAFEAQFGEVSLLNAIEQASQAGGITKIHATCTVAAAADADVSGPSNDNNLDTDLGDLSKGSFVDDYDIFFNGQYQRPGANAAANHDVYPGTSLANGQLKFEHKVKVGDEIAVFDRAP